jgi:hypothetical protein
MFKHTILALSLALAGLAKPASAADWKVLLKDDELREWQGSGGGDVFRMKSGTLSINGAGQIIYSGGGKPLDLVDLELRAEVLTRPGGRAGLAFHLPPGNPRSSGGLEVRLDNSYGAAGGDLQKTGSLVWLRPVVKSVVADDRWFSLHVVVRGPRVRVWVDKELVMDYVEPGKLATGPRLKRGTIGIRGHGGGGAVLIRKLQVRPLAAEKPAAAPKADKVDLQLARLREQGFAVVDYHTRLRGGLTLDDVLAHSWRTGVGAGVVVDCGKGLAIKDDKSARAFLDKVRRRPVFVGMRAQGREWVRLFSPKVVAGFDYVLTDSITITDHRGRRVRLWVKEEVDVPDAEKFMDLLVKQIETTLDTEPVDVYASPTYLPEALAKDHDRLWTAKRMKRVVGALARNGVALEINEALRLPRPALIKMAKEADVKFAFGGDNPGRTLGRLGYCRRMVEECALTPEDLWSPKPDGEKPIQTRKRK